MKNLKRALAVLVVVTMMISTVAFASFSDLDKASASVVSAVNVDTGLNLIKGYEDGTFKPDGDITRAEFAAIVVRAIGQEAQAAGAATATSFTDVKADHWAAGYINIVTRLGIVNGYGDGTFGPEDKVLYEQAIKMIVVALGYTPAIGSAGYPVGYLTKAGELGITSGVAGSNGVAANRGTVAQLIFNALDIPLMQQTGYGTNLDYVVQDGINTNTSRKTLMSEYLNVVKLQVTVNSADIMSSSSKTANDVKVTILNNYKTKYATDFPVNNNAAFALDAGKSGIADLVGTKAFAYVSYDSNSSDTPVVVYAVKDTSKTDELTIAGTDIETAIDNHVAAVAAVYSTATPPVLITPAVAYVAPTTVTVGYWANTTDRQTTKVTLPVGATVYYNGALKTSAVLTAELAKDAVYGSVTFEKLDTSTTQDYDTVFITDYTNYVVDSVNATTFRVSSKNNGAISFDPNDSTVKSTLYDSKGVEMKWTDLKEWDVVSAKVVPVGINSTQSKKVVVGTLVANNVTGKISEVEAGSSTDGAKDKFTIADKQYKIDSNIKGELGLDDSGTFYLDVLGNICYYDTTSALNTNYAYVVAAAPTTGIDNRTQLKLYTAKGEFVTLTTAQKVKVDGISNIVSSELAKVDADNTVTPAIPENTTVPVGPFLGGANTDTDLTNYNAAKARYEDEGIGTKTLSGLNNSVITYSAVSTIPEVIAGQFITYDVNSSNEITMIDRPNTTRLAETGIKGVFAQYGSSKSPLALSKYSATSGTLETGTATSKVYLTDKTVVMIAYGTTEEDYELVKVASIADEQVFPNVTFYNVNENREVGAVVIGSNVTLDSATSGIAAISSGATSSTNDAGDTINKFKMFQGGVATSVNGSTDFDASTMPILGAAAIPNLNAKGEVKSFTLLAVPSATSVNFSGTPADTSKVVYYYGLVSERRTNKLTLTGGRGTDIAIPAGVPVYEYDARSSSTTNRVTIGDITDFDAKIATATDVTNGYATAPGLTFYQGSGDPISKVYAIAREYDGKIVDVMIYILK